MPTETEEERLYMISPKGVAAVKLRKLAPQLKLLEIGPILDELIETTRLQCDYERTPPQ